MTAGLLLPFALADPRGRLDRRRRREVLIGAGVTAAALAVFTFALFGTGPLHLPGTIENVQSKGNWQSVPGFISTRLGLGYGRGPGAADPERLFAGVCELAVVARLARPARLDRRRGLGGGRAACHRGVAAAVVRGLADAPRGTRRRAPLCAEPRSESPW